MTIERSDFDSITESDLQELVDAQVPEGLRLEYKLLHYGKTDTDKGELLKDISAFANSHGGHLLLGVEETEGVATKLVGLDIDADSEILRIEQITRNGIEPPIPGIRIKAILLSTGLKIIFIRIPRSWNPPHRVKSKGVNRFYLRHSAGVHEPSVEELRALFNQSTSALEQARRFRDERIRLVSEGIGERPLKTGGRLFLHIVPVAAFSGIVNIDVEQVYEKDHAFWPFGASGATPKFNYYGFINERGGDENYGYTQIFRNGALEATKADIVREREDRRFIPGLSFEKYIFQRFSQYIIGLRDIGVPPPLIIMFTLENVQGVDYVVNSDPWGEYDPPLPEPILTLPECIIEEYGSEIDHQRAVRPAFDALWNAIGYSRSQFFNESGLWVGKQKR